MKLLEWIDKSNAKKLSRRKYTKYKIVVEFIDGETESFTYENYFSGDKDNILNVFIKSKGNMIIVHGKAYSILTPITSIKAIGLDSIYGYYIMDAPITTGLKSWMTKDELINNNNKYKNTIKYSKYKIKRGSHE